MYNNVSFHIAKAEWRKLFYSPIAWLLLILFIIQAGTTLMDWFAIYGAQVGTDEERSLSYECYRRFFGQIQTYVYLYVPLLTMGLMSEELSSGSINLMYAAPISNRQIVWGKYLAIAAYGLLLCGILLVDIILGIGAIRHFEWGMALVGMLGVFLLFCTYAAIGLFMSSLISYQLIAAVGTFALFAFLNIVGPMGVNYSFLRDISYWLSINGRAEAFSTGLLTTEGIIYFAALTALFLTLTVFRLNAVRQKIPFLHTLGKNLLAIGLTCLIGYFSALPALTGYWDTTSRKVNTLHPLSQKILDSIPEDITITLYANVLDYGATYLSSAQVLTDKHDVFGRFLRFKPNIKFKYVGFYDNILNDPQRPPKTEKELKEQIQENAQYFKWVDTSKLYSPSQIREVIDLTAEENHTVRHISTANGRCSWLRFFHGTLPPSIEPAISIAFKQLLTPSPVVGFVTESRYFDKMKDGFRYVFSEKGNYCSFENMGFDVCQISLSNPVAKNISLLVLADLPASLTKEQERHLQEYIDRGGNLILLAEPRNRQVMNPLLQKFGFIMGDGILVQKTELNNKTIVNDQIIVSITPQASTLSSFFHTQNHEAPPVAQVAGCAPLVALQETEFKAIPLLQTAPSGSWNELQQEFITEEYNVEYNPETGERQEAFVTAVALTREVNNQTQKILLAGDADLFSNLTENWYSPVYGNQTFIAGIAHWFSNGEYPLYMRTLPPMDNVFNYSKDVINTLNIIHVYLLPGVLVITFLLLWFKRKSR